MHDLLAAKEIINEIIENANKNNLKKVSKVVIELGQKKYAHGGHEHMEKINPENLEFNLNLLAKNTIAEK
ncbi:hypothetical protein KKG29_02925, partial [Patescibacteria group bacterium]|nr:hypothetical protein [Patescibacteria group bacterium]